MPKKRGNGEGGVYKRSNGRWAGQYVVQTPTGPKRKTVSGANKTEVLAKVREGMAESTGGVVFDDNLTLGEFMERWLHDSVKGGVKAITFEQYRRQTRIHIIPVLGSTKLPKLTPAHIQSLYQRKLDEGLSPTSVRYIHAVLNRALKQALRWRFVRENVAAATDPPKPQTKTMSPLDAEQAKRFLDAARRDRLEALFVVAVTAGLRIGELSGLRWEDLDLDRKTMRVARTLSRAKEGPRYTTPKTGKGRSIALTQRAVESLRSHRTAQNKERLAAADYEDSGLVFCTPTGRPLSRERVDRGSLQPILGRAGLVPTDGNRITPHDLRHTCATLLLSQNVHPKYVQELLGHAKIAMTLDRYSHWIPSMGDHTARAMEAALG